MFLNPTMTARVGFGSFVIKSFCKSTSQVNRSRLISNRVLQRFSNAGLLSFYSTDYEIDDNPISRNRKNLRRLLSASDGRSGEMSWSRFTVSFNVFFSCIIFVS